jgi:hypothetical protein
VKEEELSALVQGAWERKKRGFERNPVKWVGVRDDDAKAKGEQRRRKDYFQEDIFSARGAWEGPSGAPSFRFSEKLHRCFRATCANLPLSLHPTNVEVPGITVSMASQPPFFQG